MKDKVRGRGEKIGRIFFLEFSSDVIRTNPQSFVRVIAGRGPRGADIIIGQEGEFLSLVLFTPPQTL